MPFLSLRKLPCFLLSVFIMKGLELFSDVFFCIYWNNHVILEFITIVHFINWFYMLKLLQRKSQAHNGITCGKAHDTEPEFNTRLSCSFHLHQKCNLNQPVWNFLVNTIQHKEKQAICMIKTMLLSFSPKRFPSLKLLLSSLLLITPLVYLFSYENFPFCQIPLNAFLPAQWDATSFLNHLTKPLDLQIYLIECCL